ncbi:pistil-specific extensin-like protein [Melia azedarach]|uniref:Pistil-specific extensin-like protein n=1 Tax=Melia azedarach TaxID=155640 RepID=A0ACC1X5B1_MELAZ|nr:pistil-specific extensin-like protein [Melia azedarach]
MATLKLMMLYAAVAVAAVFNLAMATSYYEEVAAAAEVIHVGGKVLCQDCSKSYKEWVNGSQPLKGVKVSLTCVDERSRVMCYKSDITDEQGQFDMTVNKLVNGKKQLKVKFCLVRLVSSSHPVCNIATDFAGGKTGIKLMRPTFVYNDLVKYGVGPFYYTTPMCEKPDTNEYQGSNY